MHELSIALSILDCAAEQVAQHGGGKIVAVHLKLGPLSGVIKEALIGAYDQASKTSEAPGSRLVIEEAPLIVYCPTCKAERQPVSVQELCCPVCGAPTPEIRSGRELEVTGMEIQ